MINFLNKSEYLSITLDLTESLFSDGNIEHFYTLRTDGFWIWSGDLKHYTEKNYFIWPKEFVNHIASIKEIDISQERFEMIEKFFEYP